MIKVMVGLWFAFVPACLFGLFMAFIFQSNPVGWACFIGLFGLGCDVIFRGTK